MQALYDIPAPAKLNLFLHVTGRRDDGYHLLQSVFMLIDWHDTLHFELRTDGLITREDLTTPLPADDLIIRAARLLKNHTHCDLGAHIGITKNIPTQAGMGGGSSDAATCLLALNRLWNLGLNRAALSELGLKLGADVPFFISGTNAWVQGIGENITPIELPVADFLVIKPQEGLDTASIFKSEILKRNTKTVTLADFAAKPFDFGRNDLQPVAMALCPNLESVFKWLAKRGLSGRLTGSGSAVFARKFAPIDVYSAPPEWIIKDCKNLLAHPLVGWC